MHTSYQKGTPVRIILRNGEIIEGKFMDKKSGRVLLDNNSVELSEVRAMSIRKLKASIDSADSRLKFRIDRQK